MIIENDCGLRTYIKNESKKKSQEENFFVSFTSIEKKPRMKKSIENGFKGGKKALIMEKSLTLK